MEGNAEAKKSHILTPAQGLLESKSLTAQPSPANNVTLTQAISQMLV
jgi:hypothetical protein